MEQRFSQWKQNTQPTALTVIQIVLVLAWGILGLLMHLKWADWLFIPMLCGCILAVILGVRKRKTRQAICAGMSFVILAILAATRLLDISQNSTIQMWINIGAIVATVVLYTVGGQLLNHERTSEGSE